MSPTVMSPSRTSFSVTAGSVTTPPSLIVFQALFKDMFFETPGVFRYSISLTCVRTDFMRRGLSALK